MCCQVGAMMYDIDHPTITQYKQKQDEINNSAKRSIKDKRFVKAPKMLVMDPKATPNDKAVYLVIAYHAFWDKLTSFPSQEKIASKVGVTQKTVRVAIKHLCELGYLKKHFMGKRKPYVYELTIPEYGKIYPTETSDTGFNTHGNNLESDNNNLVECGNIYPTQETEVDNNGNSSTVIFTAQHRENLPTNETQDKESTNHTSTTNISSTSTVYSVGVWDRHGGEKTVLQDLFLKLERCYGPQKFEALIDEFFDTDTGEGQQQDFFCYLLKRSPIDNKLFMRVIDNDKPFTPTEYTQWHNYLSAC